jgi:hypothetical protein
MFWMFPVGKGVTSISGQDEAKQLLCKGRLTAGRNHLLPQPSTIAARIITLQHLDAGPCHCGHITVGNAPSQTAILQGIGRAIGVTCEHRLATGHSL